MLLPTAADIMATKSPPSVAPVPFPRNDQDVELPHYATLDFDVCPVALVHETILFRYIRVHSLRLPFSSISHPSIARLVREMRRENVPPLTLAEWGNERSDYGDYKPVTEYTVSEWTQDASRPVRPPSSPPHTYKCSHSAQQCGAIC
jgi:hypothetical protein